MEIWKWQGSAEFPQLQAEAVRSRFLGDVQKKTRGCHVLVKGSVFGQHNRVKMLWQLLCMRTVPMSIRYTGQPCASPPPTDTAKGLPAPMDMLDNLWFAPQHSSPVFFFLLWRLVGILKVFPCFWCSFRMPACFTIRLFSCPATERGCKNLLSCLHPLSNF